MKYKKTCDECKVEFSFSKKDVKEKIIIEWESDNFEWESVKKKGFWAELMDETDEYKIVTGYEMEIKYKYIECPICSDHNLLNEIEKKRTGKTETNKYKAFSGPY